MLRSSQICKKCAIFGNLRTITQEGKNGTRKMTPFFSSTFVTVCDTHFYIWKLSKFIFMGSPLWPILVCKIPEFLQWKLLTWRVYLFVGSLKYLFKINVLQKYNIYVNISIHVRHVMFRSNLYCERYIKTKT